jgi:uncharacterized NAD-dependent epimerase/dehydratase family protein
VEIKRPYLLFLGDAHDQIAAKTAQGIAQWRPDWCLGQLRLPGCQADLGLKDLALEDAVKAGAKTLILGVANRGGVIPPHWITVLVRALELGLDLASGLHHRLVDIPEIKSLAERTGRQLVDVRHPTQEFDVASGVKRPGMRLLTVGTDCSVGKMYTTLALERAMRERGMPADFRATGQTGIFIAGSGISVDAVVADFISGAVEWLAPAASPGHWDVIEGQGSLYHASFAGVSLGLLHGAQPDAIVLCHEPGRPHMRGLPGYKLPPIKDCIETNLAAGRLTNPDIRCIGISLNTANLTKDEGARIIAETEESLGLPCVDPLVTGVDKIVDRLQQTWR